MSQRTTGTVVIELGRLFDREPPAAVELEAALVGCVVLDPSIIPAVTQVVPDGGMFHGANYGTLYDVALRVYRRTGGLDRLLLLEACRDRQGGGGGGGILERLGGEDALLWICESVPVASNWPYYARVVREKWRLRRAAEIAAEALHTLYLAGDAEDLGDGELLDRLAARWLMDLGELAAGGASWGSDGRVRTRRREGRLPGADHPRSASTQLERLRGMSGGKKGH